MIPENPLILIALGAWLLLGYGAARLFGCATNQKRERDPDDE